MPECLLEVKTQRDITADVVADFETLLHGEIDCPKRKFGTAVKARDAIWVHTCALRAVCYGFENNEDFSLILARESNHELQGYSIVILDREQVDPFKRVALTFLGVRVIDWGKGIAPRLVTKRNEVLLAQGFPGYITEVRNKVLRVYDKAGVNYTQISPGIYGVQSSSTRVQVFF